MKTDPFDQPIETPRRFPLWRMVFLVVYTVLFVLAEGYYWFGWFQWLNWRLP